MDGSPGMLYYLKELIGKTDADLAQMIQTCVHLFIYSK